MKISNPDSRRFYWVSPSRDGSQGALSGIPVLEPADLPRKERWKTVLHWYGLRENSETLSRGKPRKQNAQRHWLLVHRSLLSETVDYYCQARGRQKIIWDDWAGLKRRLKGSPRSVLLVAPRRELSYRNLEGLQVLLSERSRPVSWGLISGLDREGVSFALAKVLAPEVSYPDRIINAASRRLFSLGRSSVAKESRSFEQGVRAFARSGTRLAILFAHGEGAHANLDPLILCGLTRDEECDLEGNPIGGCRLGKCKRAPRRGEIPLPVFSLKAAHSLFLSCNGFSIRGEHFPSDLSFIMSASEGFMKSCLTTIRPVTMTEEISFPLAQMMRNGARLGEALKALNALSFREERSAGFVLFGDPSTGIGRLRHGTAQRRDLPKSPPRIPRKEITPLEEKLLWALHLEGVLRDSLLDESRHDRPLVRSYFRLMEARQDLQLLIAHRSRGFTLPDFQKSLSRAAARWREALVPFLRGKRLHGDEFDLARGLSRLERTRRIGPCGRCGNARIERLWHPSLTEKYRRVEILCSVCGLQSTGAQGHAPMRIRFMEEPRRGKNSRLAVTGPLRGGDGLILGEVKDKSSGKIVRRIFRKWRPSFHPLILRVSLPQRMGPDLHTVRLIYLDEFDFSATRLRFTWKLPSR